MSLQQNVSGNSSKAISKTTTSEDQARQWANNVIEKSIRDVNTDTNAEPKLNWIMIICVTIIVVIAIIYFIYSSKPAEVPAGNPIEAPASTPLLDQPVIPTGAALTAIADPVNTSGTVQA